MNIDESAITAEEPIMLDETMVHDDLIKAYKDFIKTLTTQLSEKDSQIAELHKLIEGLHKLIENNQVLLKEKPKQDTLLLEEHFEKLDTKLLDIKDKMADRKEHQKTKGFFSKLFSGKDEG